jgi:uncharacterized membrane protein YphA (DoxX/SURF4 family)
MPLEQQNKRLVFLVLRLFLGLFWLLQSFYKWWDPESRTGSLRNLGIWAHHTVASFASTPLPAWAVSPYAALVPYIELALGLLLLLGFRLRATLVFACVYLVSLDVGLMFQGKHETVANNTPCLLAMLWALLLEPYGRVWSIDAARQPPPSAVG